MTSSRGAPHPSTYDLGHHGDAESRGARVDFAVNVIPERPPRFVLDAMSKALATVASYPDERPVREHLAHRLGVASERVLLVNGAAEGFTLLAHAHPWKRAVVVHPQFTEPEAALRAAGVMTERHLLQDTSGFTVAPHDVSAQTLARADFVVVGNPTNPTSRLHPAALLQQLRSPGRVLAVDEAFMDVVSGESESLLPEAGTCGDGLPVVVLRSLTKTFGLAGVRAGFMVGPPKVMARLRERQPPWSVNAVALAAIRAIASDAGDAWTREVTHEAERRRPSLVAVLEAAGFRVVEGSRAPFVLATHPRAAQVREELAQVGVAVRRGDTFPGLGPQWLRFALRGEEQVAVLANALQECPSL